MKQVLISLIMFVTAFLLFVSVIYAWFSLSDEADIQPLSSGIIDHQVDVEIEFGKNGGATNSFLDPADLNAFLDSTIPGDFVDVKVIVLNNNPVGTNGIILNIQLMNIMASITDVEYDLTDFFYINQGTVTLTWYESEVQYVNLNPYLIQPILLDTIDNNPVVYYGIELQTYRLSNVFNHHLVGQDLIIENNVTALESGLLQSGQRVVIEFSIGLDSYTPDSHTGFQLGELSIDGVYTTFNPE